MPTVQDVLASKGAKVHSIEPGATVLDATHKMNQHRIGALVVMSGDQVAGMFTERDVLRRIVGEQRNPATTLVAEVMTDNIVCCAPETEIDEVSEIMRTKRIRHVPVCV